MQTRILYAAIPAAVSAAFFFACSGSDNQDVIAPVEAGTEDVTTSDSPTFFPDGGGSDAESDRTVTDGPAESGYSLGDATTIDAGGIYEGGVPCVTDGVLETEPGNDAPHEADGGGSADRLNPAVCGAILLGTGPDGGIDVDYLWFRLKNTTTRFFVQFQGNIKLTISVEGADGGLQTTVITPTQGGAIPYVQNKDYTVKVESNDGQRQNWIVRLHEDP